MKTSISGKSVALDQKSPPWLREVSVWSWSQLKIPNWVHLKKKIHQDLDTADTFLKFGPPTFWDQDQVIFLNFEDTFSGDFLKIKILVAFERSIRSSFFQAIFNFSDHGGLFRELGVIFRWYRRTFSNIKTKSTFIEIKKSRFRSSDFYFWRSMQLFLFACAISINQDLIFFFVADIFYRSQTLLDFFSISFLSLSNDQSLSKSRKIYITNPNSNS